MNKKTLLFLACQLSWLLPQAQEGKKPLTWQEIPSWHYIRMNGAQSSEDGKWFAYVAGPSEGDLTLTLKSTKDTVN